MIQYTHRDLSLTPELEAGASEAAKETRIALRATYTHDNAIKARMKREWTRDQQQKVASVILDSMRLTAVSRYEDYKISHQQLDHTNAIIEGAYNGISMARSLVAEFKAGAVDEDDAEEHQDKVDGMILSRLADGCSLKEYTDKVTLVRVKHNPFLQRPYAAAQLSRLYQQFLPANLAVDARNIRRSLEAAGDWVAPDIVLQSFMKLVKQVHKSEIQAAAAAAVSAAAISNAAAISAAAALPGGGRGGKGSAAKGKGGKGAGGRAGAGRGTGGRGSAPAANARTPTTTYPNGDPKPPSPYLLSGGRWCSTNTCHLDHDTRRPGEACYRKSDVSPKLPERIWNSPKHLASLDRDRLENHKYHNLPGQPKQLLGPNGDTVRPTPEAAAAYCDTCMLSKARL